MDDFDRPVLCLAGLPFDAVTMAEAVTRVRAAAEDGTPCFLSTPNLNFLIACQNDAAFRDSVINSELSIADGMPLVWMARLLGLPIRERVAGSGLFDAIWRGTGPHAGGRRPLAVYFFGGPDGVAERACAVINATPSGFRAVGFECPGFGSVEEMSGEETIALINASGADFVLVALGARKGQEWIERNRSQLSAPVISHLGAVVNFVAGTVSRAPRWMQRSGLEWLWRIKEEPGLWRRYWNDGTAFLGLLFGRVLPYALWRQAHRADDAAFSVRQTVLPEGGMQLVIEGAAPESPGPDIRTALREAAAASAALTVDCSRATSLSPAFFGLLLILKKHRDAAGKTLDFSGVGPSLRRHFVWNGVEFLLNR